MQWGLGSAPAPGAVDRVLAVHRRRRKRFTARCVRTRQPGRLRSPSISTASFRLRASPKVPAQLADFQAASVVKARERVPGRWADATATFFRWRTVARRIAGNFSEYGQKSPPDVMGCRWVQRSRGLGAHRVAGGTAGQRAVFFGRNRLWKDRPGKAAVFMAAFGAPASPGCLSTKEINEADVDLAVPAKYKAPFGGRCQIPLSKTRPTPSTSFMPS
jgi:hypothetical protein